MITRKISELKEEVTRLGIEDRVKPTILKNGKERVGKRELVEAISSYHLERRGGPDFGLSRMLQIESPMLCARYHEISQEEQEEIWKSTKWGVEEKYDGCRCIVIFGEGRFQFFSRHRSVETCLPHEWDCIYSQVNSDDVKNHFRSFILDGEIISTNPRVNTVIGNRGVVTETQLQAITSLLAMDADQSIAIQKAQAPLQFHLFDVLEVDGHSLLEMDFVIRRRALAKIVPILQRAGMDCQIGKVYFNPRNKRRYFETILESDGEGVIAKREDSLYLPTLSRSKKNGWIKVKRSASGTLAQLGGDTIDGFITGGVRGRADATKDKIVGFEVSAYITDGDKTVVRVIATVTNLQEALVDDITTKGPDNTPELNPAYLDRVVTVDGQNFSSRKKTLRHATFISFREDKTKHDCRLEMGFIEANIM